MPAKVLCCLICEDFRHEVSGKATLVGFSGALPHHGLKLKQLNVPLPPIVFLFLLEPGLTCRQLYLEMHSPSGQILWQTRREQVPSAAARAGMQLPFRLAGFKPAEFGTHHLRLLSEEGLICDYGLPVVPILPPVPPPTFGLIN